MRGYITCTIENLADLGALEQIEEVVREEAAKAGIVVCFTASTEVNETIDASRESLASISKAIDQRKRSISDAVWQNVEKPSRYCNHCKTLIAYEGETPAQWRVVRLCRSCRETKQPIPDTKYCRVCRKPRTKTQHRATRQSWEPLYSLSNSWAMWSSCDDCHVPTINLQELIDNALAADEELQELIKKRDKLLQRIKSR